MPPACRDEIVGDLHERYNSSRQYALDAFLTVPLVIFSRIRRTTDPQILVLQALAVHGSLLLSAWLKDRALLNEPWGLLRLALPVGIMLLSLILEDAYAKPGWRSPLMLVRGPVIGLALAMSVAGSPIVAVPRSVAIYGLGLSLGLSWAIRLLFPPATNQRRHAKDWATDAAGISPIVRTHAPFVRSSTRPGAAPQVAGPRANPRQ